MSNSYIRSLDPQAPETSVSGEDGSHSGRTIRDLLFIVLCSVALYVIFDGGNTQGILESINAGKASIPAKLGKFAFVVGMAVLTYLSVSLCLLHRSWLLKTLGLLLIALGAINSLCAVVTGSFLSSHHISIAIHNSHFAGEFFQQNKRAMAHCALEMAVAGALIIFVHRYRTVRVHAAVALTALMLASVLNMFFADLMGPRRSTIFFTNPPIATYRVLSRPSIPYQRRRPVDSKPTTSDTPTVLVLVIDESITYETAKYVGSLATNPKALFDIAGVSAFSFKAHSAGNNSAVSNYILRTGFKAEMFPSKAIETLTLPTIFSYAKAAGFKTLLMDAQAELGQLQNYMSQFDLEVIDSFMTSEVETPKFERDIRGLERVAPAIHSASPNNKLFITFVKYGAHFPYTQSLSDREVKLLPEECAPTDLAAVTSSKKCRRLHYEGAVRSSTNTFLAKLLGMLKGKDFAIVYTSDHGQNLDSTQEMPHGSLERVSECEISVPITVVGERFRTLKTSTSVKSHFDVAPTLQALMGYVGDTQTPTSLALDRANSLQGAFASGLWEPDARWERVVSSCQ